MLANNLGNKVTSRNIDWVKCVVVPGVLSGTHPIMECMNSPTDVNSILPTVEKLHLWYLRN